MDITCLVNAGYPGDKLLKKAAGCLFAEWSMPYNVIKQLSSMYRLQHLAVVHFLDYAGRGMSDPSHVVGFLQAYNVGVLTQAL